MWKPFSFTSSIKDDILRQKSGLCFVFINVERYLINIANYNMWKIGDLESDIGSEYDTEKTIERVEDWGKIKMKW